MADKDKPAEGTGFTGEPARVEAPEPAKQPRKAEDIRPGDLVTVPMTVAEKHEDFDAVILTLVDGAGNVLTVRHQPGDGIAEVERPAAPVAPFRGANFAGGVTRGPV